jgi:hypothetical protein
MEMLLSGEESGQVWDNLFYSSGGWVSDSPGRVVSGGGVDSIL